MSADSLHFHCPACGQATLAAKIAIGETARCTQCGKWIIVPGSPAIADDDDTPPVVLLPASAGGVLRPPAAALAAQSPTIPPIQIDISKIPGLSTKSAVYKETRKTYEIGHRPSATLGHAFNGGFGCVFGICMALLAGLIVLMIFAEVLSRLQAQ